jgi:hypothetical protein
VSICVLGLGGCEFVCRKRERKCVCVCVCERAWDGARRGVVTGKASIRVMKRCREGSIREEEGEEGGKPCEASEVDRGFVGSLRRRLAHGSRPNVPLPPRSRTIPAAYLPSARHRRKREGSGSRKPLCPTHRFRRQTSFQARFDLASIPLTSQRRIRQDRPSPPSPRIPDLWSWRRTRVPRLAPSSSAV